MNKSNLLWTAAFSGALLLGVQDLRAGEGHDHHHDHGHSHHEDASEPGHTHAAPVSHDGMTTLYQHLGMMEKELAAGKLEGMHGHDEAIQAAVAGLDKDTALTDAKKKRVEGYVKNLLKITGKIHAAADGNKLDQARKDFEKLKAQVDLLDKQFSHSHKPGAGKPAKEEEAHSHPAK
jgi:hypothetical protein